ncbi:MAG TPA: EVE domain-containing protein [Caulobacterales bacterium]|jgi:predicted RNA-binding protein with PUA-like domain|nr:EVE domain-containing protein [Caulobacterales bacterium]
MAYWLVKSEPETFSWDDLVKAGAKGEPWTGVRNHAAKLHLMAMKKGDRAFYYHSGGEREVVGVAEVTKAAYPDPTASEGPWVCVDIKSVAPTKTPVTLDAVKKTPKLKDMALVKFSRLSVQPVTDEEWALVCKMGGVKA